jgi:hypothetical protein
MLTTVSSLTSPQRAETTTVHVAPIAGAHSVIGNPWVSNKESTVRVTPAIDPLEPSARNCRLASVKK